MFFPLDTPRCPSMARTKWNGKFQGASGMASYMFVSLSVGAEIKIIMNSRKGSYIINILN